MEEINFYIFAIYVGAAILATLALYARQVLPVVYIILGAILVLVELTFCPIWNLSKNCLTSASFFCCFSWVWICIHRN